MRYLSVSLFASRRRLGRRTTTSTEDIARNCGNSFWPNGKAYYQREEIAAAIAMAREDSEQHRVVPVYLDDPSFDQHDVPYGLRLKHSLSVARDGGLQGIAQRLQQLIHHLTGEPLAPSESPALTSYKADLSRALDRHFPIPAVDFGITAAGPDGRTLAAPDLITEVTRAKRVVLRASAGAGKSMLAGRLSRLLQDNNLLPVIRKRPMNRSSQGSGLAR